MRKALVAVPLMMFLGSSIDVGVLWSQSPAPADALARREDAYRSANLGVALIEQFRFAEGAEELRKALAIDPKFAAARVNLAIALLYVPDLAAARAEAERAGELLPNAPEPPYLLGLIARTENRVEDALLALRKVLALDPQDVGANIVYGQLRLQEKAYDEALAAFDLALHGEPYNVTAAYNRGIALTRAGKREEGARAMALFQQLRDSNYRTNLGQNYLEQGRYAQAVASTGAEPELVDLRVPEVAFVDRSSTALPSRAAHPEQRPVGSLLARQVPGVTLVDLDSDGALDVVLTSAGSVELLRNEGGRFTDISAPSGFAGVAAFAALAGDYDNDGRVDLLLLRLNGAPTLFHNQPDGRFVDVTVASRLPADGSAASGAFLDVDHDGDLDLFLGGVATPARPASAGRLLRNNGDGTFADITAEARLDGASGSVIAVVPTDFDNRRDLDILVAHADRAPALFKNMRDGSFRDVAADVGLAPVGPLRAVAAADFNKDDFTDFFLAAASGPGWLAASNGRGGFALAPVHPGTEGATFAQFVDYDLDGLLDLFVITRQGTRVLRNLGTGWSEVTSRAVPAKTAATLHEGAYAAFGDLDGDGDQDVLLASAKGGRQVWFNEGGERNRSLRVALTGRVSNRTGVGAKVEMRAGSLRQKIETSSAVPAAGPADVVFGLGRRTQADAVRVLWSSGILQTETELPAVPPTGVRAALSVTELDRKPSSCPFLYAWDGSRFGFVTDFMGGGEMGYWHAPGVRNVPDPDEYVRIRADQLRSKDGRYELRVTNELEEVLFVDRLELLSIDHPADVLVFPDEGMTDPPKSFRLLAARDPRPLTAAVDGAGRDVLDRIAAVDRTYPDGFPLHRIRGYAADHALILDLAGLPASHTRLLLTGWTDYAFSSDNVAASQAGLTLSPPTLEVRNASGAWVKAVDLGIPVGRPQTQVVDLAGRFPTADRRLRIVTNMRVYWDQIVVAVPAADVPLNVARHRGRRADLRERGFSAPVSPDGREPYSYAYESVSWDSPWKVMPGRYTREGDVNELLAAVDDLYVVSRPGDAISLSFEAGRPPTAGSTRTFFFYANGYSKEMDINSASPDVVLPLPFHGMKSYPYAAGQEPARVRAQAARAASFNTRVVASPLMALDLAAAHRSGSMAREAEKAAP